jgi:uncharacterized protein with PQ loop repeat
MPRRRPRKKTEATETVYAANYLKQYYIILFMYDIIFPVGGLVFVNILGINLFYSYYTNVNKNPNELTIDNINMFIIFFYNSINWSIFAIWNNDLWIFLAGVFMPIGSILCVLILYGTLQPQKKNEVFCIFVSLYIYLLAYIVLICYTPLHENVKNTIVNYSLLFFNMCNLMAPLTSAINIIKTKSTKTLYLPFTLVNISSSTLWMIYGIMLNNYYLVSVNCVGIFTATVELILFGYYNIIISPAYNNEITVNLQARNAGTV